MPDSSGFEIEIAIEKLIRHKSRGINQIPAKLIKAVDKTTFSDIHKHINSIWNKEEFPEEWKESITVPIYKKGDKTDCNNYRGITLLSNTYKILTNILLSRLTPQAKEIVSYHQGGFRRKRSTTEQISCIRKVLEKKWENQLLNRYLAFVKYLRRNGKTIRQCIKYIHSLQLVRRSCIIFSLSLVSP